ncbi:uncharacterized protein EV420DRAFT_1637875 [Desarmillaria tabescens]|uniref:NACHT domain-containing protein n=1 Tax=Armillaria tabescens TaxID=1929756 RepID=A0AA39NER5_ARMTA|nr:uncharacterized protein EV420DRAFT_1637875 [Desarmillaria tabescens]KAK0464302.1 hypothetical protein EV420DRAFT_1637875 [Desarmillaria tabescens]
MAQPTATEIVASSPDSANGPSVFMCALNRYIDQLDNNKKLHKRKFLADCIIMSRGTSKPNAETVNVLIQEIEKKNTQRKKPLMKVLRPIVDALIAFDGVLSALASTDPMPSSIIWAALSFIVKGAHRYFELFDKIRRELNSLSLELERMAEYESLYGDSENMRNLLCDSYMSVLRFWSAIEKQCEESCIKGALKQVFSFNADKLNEIIEEIKDNSDGIAKLAQIAEARLEKGAREDASREWKEAQLERIESRKERQAASQFREEQRQEHQDDHYRKICAWLGSQKANSSNTGRHKVNVDDRAKMTCRWLLSNSDYVTWKLHNSAAISDSVPEPILWVHGPPGSGKTFLCSRAIQDIQEAYPDAAVVYHFFQFDKSYTAAETLSILADSLFQIYWDRHRRVSEELYNKTQRNSHLPESIQKVIELLVENSGLSKLFFFLDGLDEELDNRQNPYSVSRWETASTVLEFIIRLVEKSPSVIRLWCSSQHHPPILQLFSTHIATMLDVKEDAKEDVKFYLTAKISELGGREFSDEQKREIMSKLEERVQHEGNFLWARFMISDIQEVADDLSKIKAFITESHPSSINDHYRKIFDRIDVPYRQLACEVFALITFARRPLRIKEIREAISVLRNPKNPKESMPFSSKMESVFAPLIELRGDADNTNEDNRTCHLFHSTVRTFLDKYPEIFRNDLKGMECTTACCRITPNAIANACLLYLSQDCYARLLQKSDDGRWRVQNDGLDELVEDHRFLIYSAKYWDKHLDDLSILDSPDALKERVRAFMTSPNFQTCIQVQSLWVDSQFGTFWRPAALNKTFLRRVLPEWFSKSEDEGFKALLQNYRLFLREWRAFLCCMKCDDPECILSLYAGQVDRCWWAALGPKNFLSKLPERYISFAFKETDDEVIDWEKDSLCEGMCISGNRLKILRLEHHDRVSKSLSFLCEHWTLRGASLPILVRRQSIRTDERSTNWPTYMAQSEDDSSMRIGRASPAAFNSDCSSLRLGAQIFVLDENGDFVPIDAVEALGTGQVDASWQPSYFEDWAIRGNYVVLATRRNIATRKVGETSLEDRSADNISQDLDKQRNAGSHEDDERGGEGVEDEDEDEDDNYDEDQILDDSTSNNSDDEAYESWSECSTEHSEDFLFEDDIITPWAGPELEHDSDSSSDTSESQSEAGSDDDTDDKNPPTVDEVLLEIAMEMEGDTDSDSDSEFDESNYVPPSAVVGYGELHSDDEDCFWDDDDDDCSSQQRRRAIYSDEESSDDDRPVNYHRFYGSTTKRSYQKGMHTSITVFDTRSPSTAKVFHFSQQVRYVLYDSPPVIHPTSSLIVWPLGCGDVLFADFLNNTYFSRRLRPSTAYTRQIFMKCRFSLCGQYLHVACLEGQLRPQQRKKGDQPVRLALMVSTYYLCGKKSSRSPPTLIHRARVALGAQPYTSVSNPPYTLTWTPKELYFTCSDTQLKVYRICLFNPNKGNPDGSVPSVLVPKEVFFLPETAQKRKVYFFPPDDDRYPSRVIVGSETRLEKEKDKVEEHEVDIYYGHNYGLKGSVLSPPIGCYLRKNRPR